MTRKLIFCVTVTAALLLAGEKPVVRHFSMKPVARRQSMIPISGANGAQVPLGAAIQWNADPDNSGNGSLWYRYRVTTPAGESRLLRDFGPDPQLQWSTIESEGFYQMELTSRNLESGEISVSTANVLFTPLATNQGVVTPTINPLIADRKSVV